MLSARINPEGDKLSSIQNIGERFLPLILEQSANLELQLEGKKLKEFSSLTLINIGLTYIEKADYAAAKTTFTLALKNLSSAKLRVYENHFISATCYYGLGIVEREKNNDLPSTRLFGLGFTFLKQAQNSEHAADEASELLKLQYCLERNLGVNYLKAKMYETATQHFSRAVNLTEKMERAALLPPALSYQGLALALSGKLEEGLVLLNKARELYPLETREQSMDWASHRFHMGKAYQYQGDLVSAIGEYTEALRLRQQVITSQIGAVYLHSRLGDIHASLGECYYDLKKELNAEKWLTKARENFGALDYKQRLEEIEQRLSTLKKPQTPTPFGPHPKAEVEARYQTKKFLQYGLGASLFLGSSFFAFKYLKGTQAVPEVLSKITVSPSGR